MAAFTPATELSDIKSDKLDRAAVISQNKDKLTKATGKLNEERKEINNHIIQSKISTFNYHTFAGKVSVASHHTFRPTIEHNSK